MTRRLHIAIAAAGRFHILDLAGELAELAYVADLYSYIPKTRAQHLGVLLPSMAATWV